MTGLVVINPHSGSGKGRKIGQRVRSQLLKNPNDFLFVEGSSLAESLEQVDALCKKQIFDVLISIGGDGLIHDLLPKLIKYELPLLVVPAGTGNDLARELKLHKSNLQQLLHLPPTSDPISLDLA